MKIGLNKEQQAMNKKFEFVIKGSICVVILFPAFPLSLWWSENIQQVILGVYAVVAALWLSSYLFNLVWVLFKNFDGEEVLYFNSMEQMNTYVDVYLSDDYNHCIEWCHEEGKIKLTIKSC